MSRNRPSDEQSEAESSDAEGAEASDAERDDLAARVELLEAENRRLRDQFDRARRAGHHRAALGLAVVGCVAALGGVLFPSSGDVLFALAGTGWFAAVLTFYLTPERFIAATVGERVYAATATTGAELIGDLGLTGDLVYATTTAETGAVGDVRLFVPLHRNYVVPEGAELGSPFVVTDDERGRGLSVTPTGASLFREFEASLAEPLESDPERLVLQLRDALVAEFELLDAATVEYDEANRRVTVRVEGSAFGAVTRFDHPVASLLATGLANGLQRPVRLETVEADESTGSYLVTCDWSSDDA